MSAIDTGEDNNKGCKAEVETASCSRDDAALTVIIVCNNGLIDTSVKTLYKCMGEAWLHCTTTYDMVRRALKSN